MKQRKGLLLALTVITVFLSIAACSSPIAMEHDTGMKHETNIEKGMQAQQTAHRDGQHLKALEGGPEMGNRELRPISNQALQRRFPDIVVMRGSLEENKAALTFDDGPDNRFTPAVLDVLHKHGVKGTFFVMGSRVNGHPKVMKRIVQEGHSIGNHTYWHPKLFRESLDRLRWEVKATDEAIARVAGYSPKLFRAPYGGLNDDIVRTLGDMRFSVVGWTVDSLDWTQADASTVERNVRGNMHPGAIVLFHSGGHWTQDLSGMVKALDQMIPELKKEGVTFVTVPELLRIPEAK